MFQGFLIDMDFLFKTTGEKVRYKQFLNRNKSSINFEKIEALIHNLGECSLESHNKESHVTFLIR